MALREIRIEGDPILRKISKPVTQVTPRIQALLSDMVETMYEDRGVGLAGPQVGILRRVIVIDVGDGPMKMINPEIVERSDEQQLDIEGCLSMPNFNGTVSRPQRVKVSYMDENGAQCEAEGEGLFARCICHEIDHLDGILFRDRVEMVIDTKEPTQEMIDYLVANGLMAQEEETAEAAETSPAAEA